MARLGRRKKPQRQALAEPPPATSIPDDDPPPFTDDPQSDFLTVSSGLVGLIADTIQTCNDISDLNTAPSGNTSSLEAARKTVQSFKLTILVLFKHLRHVEEDSLKYPQRRQLVDLEDVIVVLTESILALSELGTQLVQLYVDAQEMGLPSPESICPEHATQLQEYSGRLRIAEGIMSKLLSVLRVGDEAEATRHRSQLQSKISTLVQSDIILADRLEQMRDTFGARALVPHERLLEIGIRSSTAYGPQGSSNDFLPDYTTAVNQTTNDHLPNSNTPPDGRSIFTGLTLADISILSELPLPINSAELKYGKFYTFAYCSSVSEALAEIVEANTKKKNAPIAKILGLREPQVEMQEQVRFARNMAMQYEVPQARTRDRS